MAHNVQLALYDLSRGLAKTMSMAILGKQIEGIWHTGIIVYGKEYFFGGGLQSMPHETFVQMHGGARPTEYIELGSTDIPQDAFEDWIREVSPRFTAQTYDLLKHNCNNYTDEAAKFLLGKGIPHHIIDLPNEVLSSPMGGMLRPVLEQMTTQMNGADPYSALHQQQQQPGFPTGVPLGGARQAPSGATVTSQAPSAGAGVGSSQAVGFPVLDKHKKPLVGSDTAKAAPSVAARLKALGASVDGLMSKEEESVLDALPALLAAPKTSPVTSGSFLLMEKIISKTAAWPDKAEFLALVLMSLMVLHHADGQDMESAMGAVAKRSQVGGELSPQSLSIAVCAAANSFGTPGGTKFMLRADVMPAWLDISLGGLQHERTEVRQMCSALLNNYALLLADAVPEDGEAPEASDETTQILFGSLDGLQEEMSQMVALRRLLSAGRLVRKHGASTASLVNEVGLREQVVEFQRKSPEGEAKAAAAELLRLLGNA